MANSDPIVHCYEEIDSDTLPPADRLAVWRETGRLPMVVEPASKEARRDFRIRLRKSGSPSGRFSDITATPIRLHRDDRHYNADGLDMVSLTLMLGAEVQHCLTVAGRSRTIGSNRIFVKDFAQPAATMWQTSARSLNLHIPRPRVEMAIGDKVKHLHGKLLSPDGLVPMLQVQLLTLAKLAPRLRGEKRTAALEATIDLAATVLRSELGLRFEDQANDAGVFAAARMFIRRHLGYHRLNPELIARQLNCSRAHLYRVFAEQGETIAGYVRERRLRWAYELLNGASARDLSIGDIAYRCGFEDPVHFAKLFRQRFGLTPRSLRGSAAEHCRRDEAEPAPTFLREDGIPGRI
jgi:AraC-like DNA-binding protein